MLQRDGRRRRGDEHTLGELVRAVDVVAAHDDDGELERLPVAVHQHFCGGLARSVWVCGG